MGWLKDAEYTIKFTGKSFLVRYIIFNFEIIRKINGDEFYEFNSPGKTNLKFIDAESIHFYAKNKGWILVIAVKEGGGTH